MKNEVIFIILTIFIIFCCSNEKAKEYYEKGNIAQQNDEYENAIEYYTEAININKKYVEAYIERAISFSKIGKHKKAIADLDEAILIDPQNHLIYFNRGYIFELLEENDKAINGYSKVIELNPKYTRAYLVRGDLYTNIHEDQKAIDDFTKALELDQDYLYSFGARGINYFNLEKYDSALEDFNSYFSKSTTELGIKTYDLRVLYYRAFTYIHKNELDNSLQDWNNYIEIDNSNLYAYRSRGLVYILKNDIDKALIDFDKVMSPDYPDARLYFLHLIASFKISSLNYKKSLNILIDIKDRFQNEWEKYCVEYLSDELSLKELLYKVDNEYLKQNLYCYIGYKYLFLNNKEEAKEYFEKCYKNKTSGPIEYLLSRYELNKL